MAGYLLQAGPCHDLEALAPPGVFVSEAEARLRCGIILFQRDPETLARKIARGRHAIRCAAIKVEYNRSHLISVLGSGLVPRSTPFSGALYVDDGHAYALRS